MAGTLIVSLDFELFWGMLDVLPLEQYQENVLGGRTAIPVLLELFRKHGIHATWATVGFQFAESYSELQPFLPPEELRPTYSNPELTPYQTFSKIGKDEKEAPCFYGASLIRKIARCPGQEIGSHTFSHYYCREAGQTLRQFEVDMKAAVAIAKAKGYNLTSVVFPRNQSTPEHTAILRKQGFTAYRDEENDWIHRHIPIVLLKRALKLMDVYFPLTGPGGYVPRNEDGIVNLMGSRMYKPFFKPAAFLEKQKIRRIKRQMLYAAKKGKTFHLWWHPHNLGTRTQFHFAQLEEIFSYYEQLQKKYGMRSLNMREAAEEVLNSTTK